MKVLYLVGKICLYTALVITTVLAAIVMGAARAGKNLG